VTSNTARAKVSGIQTFRKGEWLPFIADSLWQLSGVSCSVLQEWLHVFGAAECVAHKVDSGRQVLHVHIE